MNENKINKNIYSTIFSTEKNIVMGILNVTKDSFYDGGRYNTSKKIINQAKKMLDEGATIIDIGAQSSRPGAKQITSESELKILIPVVKLLKRHFLTQHYQLILFGQKQLISVLHWVLI